MEFSTELKTTDKITKRSHVDTASHFNVTTLLLPSALASILGGTFNGVSGFRLCFVCPFPEIYTGESVDKEKVKGEV